MLNIDADPDNADWIKSLRTTQGVALAARAKTKSVAVESRKSQEPCGADTETLDAVAHPPAAERKSDNEAGEPMASDADGLDLVT